MMNKIKDFEIGKKVRWFYQTSKWHKPEANEIVYIGSERVGDRVRIDRKNKNGDVVEGGYVMIDELYEPKLTLRR